MIRHHLLLVDLECLIEKIDGCKNNPKKSFTAKIGQHISSGFSMSTISSFKSIENKRDVCRGKDCMRKFSESLKVVSTTFLLVCFISLGEHLWSKGKCFLYYFKRSFSFWDSQMLTFQIFKCYDVIKCLSMK